MWSEECCDMDKIRNYYITPLVPANTLYIYCPLYYSLGWASPVWSSDYQHPGHYLPTCLQLLSHHLRCRQAYTMAAETKVG